MKHTDLETDLLVAGGGMAGVFAAVAAARNGAKVVLVQDRSVLGGNASSEVKMHIVGADCHGHRPGARETGLMEEVRLEDAVRNAYRNYSQWDLLLYEKVKNEPSIRLLLDSDLVGAETEELADGRRKIISGKVVRNFTEETFTIRAKFFADCTGDGRLGLEAGADFHVGRESKETYGESLARDEADSHTLGSSILFTASKRDTPQPFIAPAWVRKFTKEEFKLRPIPSYEYGYWWFEWGGQLDTISDNEEIRHELLRIALGVWDYVKNSGDHPDSANWALNWVGSIPGKRESRRFLGPYVLKQSDVQEGRIFPDRVAYGGWTIDLHPPSGVDVPEEKPATGHFVKHLYTVPLRCYHSRNVTNLFFAGRNISASHVAFASTRVMATCAIGGQAVGTAAALWREAPDPDITSLSTPEEVQRLQQTLLKDDAFVPATERDDPRDLVPTCAISADSETSDGPAANLGAGYSRTMHASFGEWSRDSHEGWVATGLPASVRFALKTPSVIREVHLTFDTGLERTLMLTPSDKYTDITVRGPQPETAKAYRIYFDDALVLEEQGNYLRKRVHSFTEGKAVSEVRIEILSSHGVKEARLFEVRIYP